MKRRILYFAIALFLVTRAHATTYYISTTGSDSGNGSVARPWATFAHAWTIMHSCDTLIVNDGKYIQTVRPPTTLSGSSSCYTTIQAVHDWGATVDGSTTTPYGSALNLLSMSYIVIRGIKFAGNPSDTTGSSGSIGVSGSDHIKIIKTAGYNAPCFNNVSVFSVGPRNGYVLVEDSHAWGCGRYKFSVWKGPFVDGYLLKKAENARNSGRKDVIRIGSRRSTILPQFVGLTFGVYNGLKHVPVMVTEDMIGHKFGEFSPTRTFHGHSGDRKAKKEA